MGWSKVRSVASGEVHYAASTDGYDPAENEITPIVQDRPPSGLEQVDDDGNIFTPVDALRDNLWAQVKALRAQHETGGADTPVGRVQTDDASKLKISGLLQMTQLAAAMGAPFAEAFTLADNSVAELDVQATIAMALAVGQHVSACYANALGLRTQLTAATTVEDLEAIDIGAGWP